MRRRGFLFREIVTFDNLLRAAGKAMRGKKDRASVARFFFDLERELLDIRHQLLTRTYRPLPLRVFTIREPKERTIGASDIRDRVVHHAVCAIIEPILERRFIRHSYACRTGKGTHRAMARAGRYCRRYRFFLKMDIRKYFESIDHALLKRMLARVFRDPDLLWLLGMIIDHGNHDGSGKGIPIGSLTSQHFANLYLDGLDHHVKDDLGVKAYLRYMDDFVIFGDSKEELHELRAGVTRYLGNDLKLEVKERATFIAPVAEGLPFLGFRVYPGTVRIRAENRRRMVRKMKRRIREYRSGRIPEDEYARSLMSMTEHLRIGNTVRFRRDIFGRMFQ